MSEIFRDIPGWEDYYQASTEGRIKSLQRLRNNKGNTFVVIPERILKPQKTRNGYLKVTLSKNGVHGTHYVHRLVALTFPEICGEYFEGLDTNHLDEDKTNNTPWNLRWCTRKVNLNWGTHNEKVANTLSKPVCQFTKTGEFVAEYPSAIEAARQTGFYHISECCLGDRKQSNGYIWVYKNG